MATQATGHTVGKVEASTTPIPRACYRKVYGTGLYSTHIVNLSWAASTRACRDGLGNEWWENWRANSLTLGVVKGDAEAIKTKVGLECAALDCPIAWEPAP